MVTSSWISYMKIFITSVTTDKNILYYMPGYIVNKGLLLIKCNSFEVALISNIINDFDIVILIRLQDYFGSSYIPSNYRLVESLQEKINTTKLSPSIFFMVFELQESTCSILEFGCEMNSQLLTLFVIKFYIIFLIKCQWDRV